MIGKAIALVLILAAGPWMQGVQAGQRGSGNSPLETIQIRPNVYVIFGAGSNVTVHVGDDGVILVDSGSAAMADRLLATIRAITSAPIRMIINTSADADHVGGNATISKAGTTMINRGDLFSNEDTATVLAHENVTLRMTADESQFPADTWPTLSYTQRIKAMYLNDDAVLVMRQLGAHSDGDSMVLFRRADVIVTGDILDPRSFPVIDPARGGSLRGELEALNRLLEITVPAVPSATKPGRTFLVPGHGRISDYAELVEYRDMLTIIRNIVQDMLDRGMTLAQVKAANPTAGHRAAYGTDSGPWTTDMFVEAIYNELKNPKP